jgi:hypothetical protein
MGRQVQFALNCRPAGRSKPIGSPAVSVQAIVICRRVPLTRGTSATQAKQLTASIQHIVVTRRHITGNVLHERTQDLQRPEIVTICRNAFWCTYFADALVFSLS